MDPDIGFYIEASKASLAEKTIEAIRALPLGTIEELSEEHPCSANWLEGDEVPRLEIHHLPTTPTYRVNCPEDATKMKRKKGSLSFTHGDFNYEFSFRE